jgi:hypothetical protein
MIAAGVTAKALSAYMGRASVTITFDVYGQLMPGNEQQAARLLDAYLRRSTGAVGKRGKKIAALRGLRRHLPVPGGIALWPRRGPKRPSNHGQIRAQPAALLGRISNPAVAAIIERLAGSYRGPDGERS